MKLRQGFVSNSSSSSFIIALPVDKNITVTVDMVKEWFNCSDEHTKQITKDINSKEEEYRYGFEEFVENLNKVYAANLNNTLTTSMLYSLSDSINEIADQCASDEVVELQNKYPNNLIANLSYSDEDGQGALEHGDHWRYFNKKFPGQIIVESHH